MEKPTTAARAGSSVADAKRMRLERLALEAQRKIKAGIEPTAREHSAFEKITAERTRLYGEAYIAAIPKADYSALTGKKPQQLINARNLYGFPYPIGPKDRIRLAAVLHWFHEFLAKHGPSLNAPAQGEDAILNLASPQLKDEYVKRKIEQADIDIFRSRIEAEAVAGTRVPLDPIRQHHNRLAELMRRARNQMSKHFEGADRLYVEERFDQLNDDWHRLNKAQFDDDATKDPDESHWLADLDSAQLEDGAAQ